MIKLLYLIHLPMEILVIIGYAHILFTYLYIITTVLTFILKITGQFLFKRWKWPDIITFNVQKLHKFLFLCLNVPTVKHFLSSLTFPWMLMTLKSMWTQEIVLLPLADLQVCNQNTRQLSRCVKVEANRKVCLHLLSLFQTQPFRASLFL